MILKICFNFGIKVELNNIEGKKMYKYLNLQIIVIYIFFKFIFLLMI